MVESHVQGPVDRGQIDLPGQSASRQLAVDARCVALSRHSSYVQAAVDQLNFIQPGSAWNGQSVFDFGRAVVIDMPSLALFAIVGLNGNRIRTCLNPNVCIL